MCIPFHPNPIWYQVLFQELGERNRAKSVFDSSWKYAQGTT